MNTNTGANKMQQPTGRDKMYRGEWLNKAHPAPGAPDPRPPKETPDARRIDQS